MAKRRSKIEGPLRPWVAVKSIETSETTNTAALQRMGRADRLFYGPASTKFRGTYTVQQQWNTALLRTGAAGTRSGLFFLPPSFCCPQLQIRRVRKNKNLVASPPGKRAACRV